MQLKPGTKLQGGKYEIVRTLGQGGFGITYLAVHTLFERKVAIKEFFMKDCCNRDMETSHVSVPSVGSKELVDKFKKKFVKEAKTIVELDHPNIVRVTDVFEENGTAYYVMENLTGGSLADKVKKEGPLSEAQAEKYIRQVADALAYIHERKTVHLDVKPSNILLNAKGDAVLIDFGISKHYDKAGEQTSSTPVGISKGYAPLEQGRDGDVKQFGPSTDIYALGATLYSLVSRQVPPEASIVNEEGLEKPDGVSNRTWHVIERSMQPKRKDRPQCIAEFLKLFDAPPEKVDDDETVVITKKEPAKGPKINKNEEDRKIFTKIWLWAVLGIIAVSAIVLAVILGKKRPADNVLPTPARDTVETVVTPEPAKQPEVTVIAVTGIKLSQTTLELEESQSATIKATVTPNNATDKTVTWKSYDEQIATVTKAGKVTTKKVGTTTIVASCGEHEASCKLTVKKPAPWTGSDNGHEWVDLGLPSGTKWATCNVGASSPGDNGNYYAWGETSTKSKYSWENYHFRTSGDSFDNVRFSKYNTDRTRGTLDNKKQLDLSDDAARSNWGGKWRIPTKSQWEELNAKCTWSWTGRGYKVTGSNGLSIFLPAAGYNFYSGTPLDDGVIGNYWSSSLRVGTPFSAWRMGFGKGDHSIEDFHRYLGYSVRPVISVNVTETREDRLKEEIDKYEKLLQEENENASPTFGLG